MMTPLFAVGLQPLDYAVIVVYMGLLIAVGLVLGWRQETAEEFFVGNRRMPSWAVGLSMLATLMSTLTYLGYPGEVIKHGLGQAIGMAAIPIAFLVVGYLWVPFFMRLGGLTSAYAYLGSRFGPSARKLGVGLFLYMRFVWMGTIAVVASRALALMTADTGPMVIAQLTGGSITLDDRGWFYLVLVATCVISTLYTALGGIRAVIWTDVLQFFVLAAGAFLTLVVVGTQTGTTPADWWRDATAVAHALPPLASWDLSTRVTMLWTVLSVFFWTICTHASDQVALQRYFATRDEHAARQTAAIGFFMNIGVQLVLVVVGMALLTYYLQRPESLPASVTDPRGTFADNIFPYFIVHGLPVGLTGLVVAAVFAVAQSSVDSGINSVATVLMVDVFGRRSPRESDATGARRELRDARRLTLAIGLVVTMTALGVTLLPERYNIIDLTLKAFNLVLGPLGAIFMAGMLLPQVGERAVVIAGWVGAGIGAVLAFADLLVDWQGPSAYLVIPLSWLATFLLAAILGGFLPGPRPEQLSGLTWRAVVRGRD